MAKKKASQKSLAPKAGTPVPVSVRNPPPNTQINQFSPRPQNADSIIPDNPTLIFVQEEASGSSGTQVFAGYFAEEYLIGELSGIEAADLYDKMRRGDAKMKMGLNAVKTPIMASPWEIQAASDSAEHKEHADFIDHVLFHDMDRPFSKYETLSLADFGYSIFEITHKPVLNHPRFGSYVGLKSLGWRSPRSILHWGINSGTGAINFIRQLVNGDLGRDVDIPGQFLLVSSLEKEGDNYEGVSLQRAALGSWKRKNLFLKLMAIGTERNAVPTPTAEIPAGKQNTDEYAFLIQCLRNYTSHQNSYVTFPEGWKIDFLKSGFDPEKLKTVIEFENSEMIGAFMANFLLLGSTQSGSRAVSMDQSQFFLGAIQYLAEESVKPHNHKLIPELVKMKYGPQEAYPQLKITGIQDKAGKDLAEALKNLAESQFIQPDDPTEEHLRKRYGLPKKSDQGVRIVKAPARMEEADNVDVTDHPDKVKAAEIILLASRSADDSDDDEEEELVEFVGDSDNPCEICDYLNGKIFAAEEAPELPLHPNCECELIPYEGKKKKSRVKLSELVPALEIMLGGVGSGRHAGGGSSKPTAVRFKKADKAVEAAGRAYDKNPTPENQAKLETAHAERVAAAQAHEDHLRSELAALKAEFNSRFKASEPRPAAAN